MPMPRSSLARGHDVAFLDDDLFPPEVFQRYYPMIVLSHEDGVVNDGVGY
jgi:hypothetical protein